MWPLRARSWACSLKKYGQHKTWPAQRLILPQEYQSLSKRRCEWQVIMRKLNTFSFVFLCAWPSTNPFPTFQMGHQTYRSVVQPFWKQELHPSSPAQLTATPPAATHGLLSWIRTRSVPHKATRYLSLHLLLLLPPKRWPVRLGTPSHTWTSPSLCLCRWQVCQRTYLKVRTVSWVVTREEHHVMDPNPNPNWLIHQCKILRTL